MSIYENFVNLEKFSNDNPFFLRVSCKSVNFISVPVPVFWIKFIPEENLCPSLEISTGRNNLLASYT